MSHPPAKPASTPDDTVHSLYRKILAPVDGCHPAQLREALRLATLCQSELCLLFVAEEYHATELTNPPQWLGIDVLASAATVAHRWCLTPEVAIVGCNGFSVGEVIVAEARQWDADLIILGHRGSHERPAGFRTTIVERVILEATAPVLVVHSG